METLPTPCARRLPRRVCDCIAAMTVEIPVVAVAVHSASLLPDRCRRQVWRRIRLRSTSKKSVEDCASLGRVCRGWIHRPMGRESMRRTEATRLYGRTKNLRAVRRLLRQSRLQSTVRSLGLDAGDALEISAQTERQPVADGRTVERGVAAFRHHVEGVQRPEADGSDFCPKPTLTWGRSTAIGHTAADVSVLGGPTATLREAVRECRMASVGNLARATAQNVPLRGTLEEILTGVLDPLGPSCRLPRYRQIECCPRKGGDRSQQAELGFCQ